MVAMAIHGMFDAKVFPCSQCSWSKPAMVIQNKNNTCTFCPDFVSKLLYGLVISIDDFRLKYEYTKKINTLL